MLQQLLLNYAYSHGEKECQLKEKLKSMNHGSYSHLCEQCISRNSGFVKLEQQDIMVSADDGKSPKHETLTVLCPALTVLTLHVGLPRIGICLAHVSNFAGVFFSSLWFEGDALGKVKLPALFEGQVSLLGIRENFAILQQFNGDIRRVEATHMAD
ncbi:hypothetical protein [Vibrio harveyi]|uniref:hypothetical protein n=1 Tax=Vibrio harveyi TaxID=669 RepID=UPI003CF329A5